MKKKTTKMTLSRETLRTLEDGLSKVVGGITKDIVMSGCSAGTPHCGRDEPPPPVVS